MLGIFKVRKKKGAVLLEQLFTYTIGVTIMSIAIVFIMEVLNKVNYIDRLFEQTYDNNSFILDIRKNVRNAQNIQLTDNQLTLKYTDGNSKVIRLVEGTEFGHLEVDGTKLFNVIYNESDIVIVDGVLNIDLECVMQNKFGRIEKYPIDVNIALR